MLVLQNQLVRREGKNSAKWAHMCAMCIKARPLNQHNYTIYLCWEGSWWIIWLCRPASIVFSTELLSIHQSLQHRLRWERKSTHLHFNANGQHWLRWENCQQTKEPSASTLASIYIGQHWLLFGHQLRGAWFAKEPTEVCVLSDPHWRILIDFHAQECQQLLPLELGILKSHLG